MTDLLICADASADIGTGHLRRMITFAQALRAQGAIVHLQTSPLGADIARAALFQGTLIAGSCDPDAVLATLRQRLFDGVILDNYHWHAPLETGLRTAVPFVAVVDDLADRAHDADLLLDQNAHHRAVDYDGLLPTKCISLVGGQYCLLAKPFQRDRYPKLLDADAPVFVSLGGGDPHKDILPITEILLKETTLSLTVATGSHISDATALRTLAAQHGPRMDLIFDSPRVADQMERSQFAIAAGGTMTWERASMGLPSLCLIIADNQVDSATWLAEREVHSTFDMRPGWTHDKFARTVQIFSKDTKRQRIYHDNSRVLVARDGAVRAARALLHSVQTSTPS